MCEIQSLRILKKTATHDIVPFEFINDLESAVLQAFEFVQTVVGCLNFVAMFYRFCKHFFSFEQKNKNKNKNKNKTKKYIYMYI